MTTLWRCCKRTRLQGAFNGDGGLYHDGRWHLAGRRIVYTSDEASLALVEVMVNGWPLDQVLRLHALVPCELPEAMIYTVPDDELPDDWDSLAPTTATQEWGDTWLQALEHVAVRVPSAVMPGSNVLINPVHLQAAGYLAPGREHVEWNPRLVRVAEPS